MKKFVSERLIGLKAEYETAISGLFGLSGGEIREGKGSLVEKLTRDLVALSCVDLGIFGHRISFTPITINVRINNDLDYITRQPDVVADFLFNHIDTCVHTLCTDVNLSIDGKFILNVECKTYTESSMLKKIMSDCELVVNEFPNVKLALLQIENSLGGDYGGDDVFGSRQAHAIMSYYGCDLKIITLSNGNRSSKHPLESSLKPLEIGRLEKAVNVFKELVVAGLKTNNITHSVESL